MHSGTAIRSRSKVATLATVVALSAGLVPALAAPSASAMAPIAAVDSTTALPVTVTQSGTTATIKWTSSTSPSSWTVGRDGVDSTGYGAWSGTASGATRSWTFNDLKAGSTYNLYAKSSVGTATIRIVAGQSAMTATAVAVDSDSAKFTWTSSTSPSSWTAGRDGYDTGGSGPWTSGSLSGSTRTFQFDKLKAGTTYTFTAKGNDGRAVSTRFTMPTSGTTTPTTNYAPQITGPQANSFGAKVSSLPAGGKMKILWTRNGAQQSASTSTTTWWSGTSQSGWSNAYVQVLDASGKVVATSAAVNPGGSTTPTPTPTPTPTTNTSVSASASVVDSDSAKVTWTTGSSPASWTAGRDGYDTGGSGPWTSGALSGSTRTFQFDKLKAGTTYTFTVKASDGRSATAKVTMPTSGTATPTPTPTNPAPAPSTGVGKRSGLKWDSGLYPMNKAYEVNSFESSRTRQADVITVFPSRESWSAMQSTWFMDSQRIPSGYNGTLDVGVPLWPNDGNVGTAAAGGYNAQWEQLARNIAAKYPNAYIRLGWEMNLPGWHAHANPQNAEQWKQAYRQAVGAIRKGGPNLRIAWVVNEGPGQTGTQDARTFYPGDAYVDYIGMDAYDWWPGYTTDANIAKHRDSAYGWNFWLDFAKQRGKKFVLPEWGIAPANSASGGDNPKYINFVYSWMNANAAWMQYESYFNESDSYIRSNLFTANPNASAEYKRWMTSGAIAR